jgi:hypothetical protein
MLASLPHDEESQIDHAALKSQLYSFALRFESPMQSVVRRFVGSRHEQTWEFPGGCTVHERRANSQVVWELSFADFESLERAQLLFGSLVSTIDPSVLSPAYPVADGDEGPTSTPALALQSPVNSRSARVAMARLIKNLVLTLDRFSVAEMG